MRMSGCSVASTRRSLRRLVATAGLTRRQPGENRGGGLGSDWRDWWRPSDIEALPEMYFRDDDEEEAYWRIRVDRNQNPVYLPWFET